MAIDNPDVIDVVGTNRESGNIVLTIADHLPWDQDNQHLVLLQAKINRYLEFIEGGQLAQEYPNAHPGVPVRIEVACKYQPSRDAEQFLQRAQEVILAAGWEFTWYLFPVKPKDAEPDTALEAGS